MSMGNILYNETKEDQVLPENTQKVGAYGAFALSVDANGNIVPTSSLGSAYAPTNIGTFGGDGADGALTITTGVTTIDCGGAATLVRNYSSISITGTGELAFSNPADGGTTIVLKSQGDATLTSTTAPNIDVSGMGAKGGVGGGAAAFNATMIIDNLGTHHGRVGNVGNPPAANIAGVIYDYVNLYTNSAEKLARKVIYLTPGSGSGAAGGTAGVANYGGGGSGAGSIGGAGGIGGTAGAGAAAGGVCAGAGGGSGVGVGFGSNGVDGVRGGGVLYIECRGSLNFTGSIWAMGVDGTNGVLLLGPNNYGAGSGGGTGGMVCILYNNLTVNTGTIDNSGGDGGDGGIALGNLGGAGGATSALGYLVAENTIYS